MRLTQGAFSFLPDLSDEQIKAQVEYCISKFFFLLFVLKVDLHPRNVFWDLWGLPLFDVKDPAAVMYEIDACRKANTTGYIKVQAFDASKGCESCVHSFIIQRPSFEPGFYTSRQEYNGRMLKYTIQSYAVQAKPAGERY